MGISIFFFLSFGFCGGWKRGMERGWGRVGEGLGKGWGGLRKGWGGGWGRVGEGLDFHTSKNPFERRC